MRGLGYMAHPYGDRVSNVRAAERIHAMLLAKGCRIISGPVQSTGAEHAMIERDWLRLCLEVVSRCDYLVAADDCSWSHGAQVEQRYARYLRIPVFDTDLQPISIRPGPALLRNWRVVGVYDEDSIELRRKCDAVTAYIGERTVSCDGMLTDSEARQMAHAARMVWSCGLETVMGVLS